MDTTPSSADTTAKGRYSQLESLREPYLRRARDCAKVTIPHLVPPQGFGPHSQLYTPYQSLGSRGVNNLAAKLLMSQLPPNTPFYRYEPSPAGLKELEAEGGAVLQGKVDAALSKYEMTILKKIESGGFRTGAFPLFKHLIVSGNYLWFLPKTGPRGFALDSYVCKRDSTGNVIELITLEKVAPVTLPENVRALIPEHEPTRVENDVELYTWIKRTEDNWTSHQEVGEIRIPDTEGTYPLDKSPYLCLRWHAIDGEDYGRGYVEDYIGDLMSLEGLSQAIVEGSAAAARVLIMVKPGSPTTMRAITKAPSGAVLSGNIDDIGVLQLDKYADFRVANEVIGEISKRLSFAFLLNTAIQRQGERVTAEEVRYMAQELEAALGGTYSVLSQEFQLPFLRRVEHMMQSAGELPKLPKGFVNPSIVTGIEALGRGHDLSKLRGFIQMLGELGPMSQAVMSRLKIGEFLDRVGAAAGIDMEGLIKTDDEVMQEEQQAKQMQAMQALGPQAVSALGGVVKQQMQNQTAEAPQAEGPPAA